MRVSVTNTKRGCLCVFQAVILLLFFYLILFFACFWLEVLEDLLLGQVCSLFSYDLDHREDPRIACVCDGKHWRLLLLDRMSW